MNLKNNHIVQIIVSLLAGSITGFLNYLFNVYMSRNLLPEEFGIFNSAMGIIYLIQVPAITIQTAVTLKVGANRDSKLLKFINSLYYRFTVLGIALSLAIIIFAGGLSKLSSVPIELFPSLITVLLISLLSPIAKGLLFGLGRIAEVNIVMIIETAVKFLIGYLGVTYLSGIQIFVLANGLPLLLSLFVGNYYANRINGKNISDLQLNYSSLLKLFVIYLLINAPISLDLILVSSSYKPEYAALTLIGKIVFFASVMLGTFMLSRLSTEKNEKRKFKLFLEIELFTLLSGGVLALGISLFKEQVVRFVFGGEYTSISSIVGIYAFLVVLFAGSYIAVNYLISFGRNLKILTGILASTVASQLILYNMFNTNLRDAVINQGIVFVAIFLSVIVMSILVRRGTFI